MNIDDAIRKVPDFPKPGILFYDITSLFMNPEAFSQVIDEMVEIYAKKNIDAILGVESRGFLFGAPLAEKLNKPLILGRKKGKLPGKTIEATYDLEYGTATLEVHVADVEPNMNILIVDDLIATGGTLKATATMLEELGANVAGVFGVIGLPFLPYQEVLKDYEVTTLINYDSE